MAGRFVWAPEGERCRMSVPFGHWQTKTLIAALRCDRIDAPMTIDGALDGAAFLACVEQVLPPTLCAEEVVVMDNVAAHIPARKGRLSPATHDAEMYKWRHLVENIFQKLKEFKRIAMRACKTDTSFKAMINLAATVIRTR